jgi:hypothetical protein
VIIQYDRSVWEDPRASWWAKLDRAGQHLVALRKVVADHLGTDPVTLTPGPTDVPGRLAYRIRYREPFPVTMFTITGDVLHNLRTALECLAFEFARLSQGGKLTPKQEEASTFPIRSSPDGFERFFGKDRSGLYDQRARRAFRFAQPFAQLEEAKRHGVALDKSFEEEFKWDSLHRLHSLWNLDKHRRLALAAWWPDMIWWGSNGPSKRRAYPGDGTLADGSILLYVQGSDDGMGTDINYDFNIVLTDDPAFTGYDAGYTGDFVEMLSGWHRSLATHTFPVMFTIMSSPVE